MTRDREQFDAYRREIEADLERFLDPDGSIEARLAEAMAYSLHAGGKRIRPMLLLAAFDGISGDEKMRRSARKLAVALEMIHTYSLIHDDLPSMDNDDLRRGQATSHRKFDEATAILAGDALLNRAYELILEAALEGGEHVVEAGGKIAAFAGARGMIGGQIIDIASEGKEVSLARLEQLQQLKTAALLRAAVAAAGLLAAADQSVLSLLDDYGQAIGLAFQIKDDILDLTSDAATMGKTVGKDVRDTKVTFVSMLGLDEASARLEREHKRAAKACNLLEEKGLDARFLGWLAAWLGGREY